jgi:hypothetical protein
MRMPPRGTPIPPRTKKNMAGGRQIVVPQRDAIIQKNQVHPCEKTRKPHRVLFDKVDAVEVMSNLR